MAELSPQERWDKWMVQAQNFAKRDNFLDALARAELVLNEVNSALENAAPEERRALERYRHRATRRHETFAESFKVWNKHIADRREAATAGAAEEMAAVLPLGPHENI
ncbi:MAG: heme oxygenase [Polyangiales bacterium]|jgi:heme oxygenase